MMKFSPSLVAVVLPVVVVAAAAERPEVQYGPPVSPISWQAAQTTRGEAAAPFAPNPTMTGLSQPPTSVQNVELEDDRPYGDRQRQPVWLARYRSVRIRGPDEHTASLSLSLAFAVETDDLICAFSDPAPEWAHSPWGTQELTERVSRDWNITSAKGVRFHSSVVEVLEVLWKFWGVDPNKTGQIIIRPRIWADKALRFDINENPLPRDPPSNAWIVELLGSVVMEHHVHGGKDMLLTTRIVALRDGDLHFLSDMLLP